jgi:O-antigen/teichoic acid export membrane protein
MFGRVVGAIAHLIACFHAMPALRHNMVFRRVFVLPLVKFGGWMTVSNVVGPLMVYADRFLVGAILSVGAVAYYTTPFDLVGRLTFISASVSGVLFPAFAASLVGNKERTALLVVRGVKYVFLSIFPIILLVVTLAPEGLRLWLGPTFAVNSQSVLRWLAVGVFINSIATVPYALIQSAGRPNITAKLHLFELPFYLMTVWTLTRRLGIEGAAIAWTGRIVLDTVLLFFFSDRMLKHKPWFMMKLTGAMAAALALLYAATFLQTITAKTVFCLAALATFALTAFLGITPDERALLHRLRRPSC